jgi:hypothetical protein
LADCPVLARFRRAPLINQQTSLFFLRRSLRKLSARPDLGTAFRLPESTLGGGFILLVGAPQDDHERVIWSGFATTLRHFMARASTCRILPALSG